MTASGCGVAIKEYEQLLAGDNDYAEKAKAISALYKDPAEIVFAELDKTSDDKTIKLISQTVVTSQNKNIAFHPQIGRASCRERV